MITGLYCPTGEMVRRSPEPPAGVLEELRAFHPLLGLRYLPFQKAWAVTWTWDENDPRRKYLQSGHTTPKDAHSIVCELPSDCGPSDAIHFVRRHLVINPPADMWKQVAERIERHNANLEESVTQAALADVMNRIEISKMSLKAHFTEGVEETDYQCHYDVEAPSADELRAAANGGVFD